MSQATGRLLFTLGVVLSAGCGSKAAVDAGVPDPLAPLTLELAEPDGGIAGRYAEVPFELGLAGSLDRRTATFGDPAAGTGAAIVTDDQTNTAVFTVGTVTWSDKATLTDANRSALKAFSKTPTGKALVNTAAYSYFKNPRVDLMPYRIAAIQLYSELSEFYDPADKQLTQPANSVLPGCPDNPCQLRSNDAIFGCSYPSGEKYDAVILLKGLPSACQLSDSFTSRHHEANNCYGACGLSCAPLPSSLPDYGVPQGGCLRTELRCTEGNVVWAVNPPVEGTTGTSSPVPCILGDLRTTYPRDLAVSRIVCESPGSYLFGTGYWLCSSMRACYRHDECLRHDTFSANPFSQCNRLGIDGAGVAAAWGRPNDGWDYKWFTPETMPVNIGANGNLDTSMLGACPWTWHCSGGSCGAVGVAPQPAPALGPQVDQEWCLVHNCKHEGSNAHCSCTSSADCHPIGAVEWPAERICRDGQCSSGPCTPRTCASPNAACGDDDGCGGFLSCSTCPAHPNPSCSVRCDDLNVEAGHFYCHYTCPP